VSEPAYEVYALRYGSNERRRRAENVIWTAPEDTHDAPMPMDFSVWVLRRAGRTVLVDTGSAAHTMRARGHDRARGRHRRRHDAPALGPRGQHPRLR
jgi:hypothetical protein